MDDGLTPVEREVVELLVAANAAYASLPEQHPHDLAEWMPHIHGLQGLIAIRIARRDYPEAWPSYEPRRVSFLRRLLRRG